jgi:hypothetical protein
LWDLSNKKIYKTGKYYRIRLPEHPNYNSQKAIMLHRVIMECHLNRILTCKEHVHHKDGNTHNNSIDNLEILNSSDHSKVHGSNKVISFVELKCPNCNKIFIKPVNNTFLRKGGMYACCSRSCNGKFSALLVKFGVNSDVIKTAINENIVRYFKL